MPLRIVPANSATVPDLDAIFGTTGAGGRCYCQRYRLAPGESFAGFPAEERAARLHEQTRCGHPRARTTSGLVVDHDDEPVGWCAVAPRASYPGLVRTFTAPWKGREEDPAAPDVWAITCLFVRRGHRRQGISVELAVAAVEHALGRGARAVEAYPITRTDVIEEELHVETVPTFEAAGMTIVSRPTARRVVMRRLA